MTPEPTPSDSTPSPGANQPTPDHDASGGRANAERPDEKAYWRANLKILAALLGIWAFSGFFLSIVFVEPLNEIKLGGFPLGFWFAQQGSIYIFIAIIFVYVVLMERLDKRFKNRGG